MAKKISELNTATVPLTGGELMEMSQAGISTKGSSQNLKDFINLTDIFKLQETDEPPEPPDGQGIIFMSNGNGGFTAGDIIAASTFNDGETTETRYTIIHDYSAAISWPGGE